MQVVGMNSNKYAQSIESRYNYETQCPYGNKWLIPMPYKSVMYGGHENSRNTLKKPQ